MNILSVTMFTPTPENYNGISGLIYHLLIKKPKWVNITLYSYNANKVDIGTIKSISKILGIDIKLLHMPKGFRIINFLLRKTRFDWLLPLQTLSYIPIPKQVKNEIQKNKYDVIWLYPYFFHRWMKKFPEQKFVLTGCDSGVLFTKRCFEDDYFKKNKKRLANLKRQYYKAIKTEQGFNIPNAKIHFVGQADLTIYSHLNNAENGFYSPHPHYQISYKEISFHYPKLKVLWAGKNDYYMLTKGHELLLAFLRFSKSLNEMIEITFLGKGWENYQQQLYKYGYEVKCITWVEDYIKEIIKYDIQVVPISLGTGTKGKVLDAMANGLLCIGTHYALENISSHLEGCLEYDNAEDVCRILIDIYANREKYEQIARNGQEKVIKEHDPELCSKHFFSHFKF